MSNCKHVRIKRKMICEGKEVGTYRAYCSQQCKGWAQVQITEADILEVYPKGRPKVGK